MSEIAFDIFGTPRPAGSKRHIGKGVVIDSSGAKGRDWRASVQAAAKGIEMLHGPLEVVFVFFAPRPKCHYGTGGKSRTLKGSAPGWPTGRPDVLKLARAVEDALTGVAWKDDSQIVDERLIKRYGEPARCEVTIREIAR